MKSLIVDDDINSCEILQELMTPLGETRIAKDSLSALDLFKKSWSDGLPFDLIFLDVAMEKGNGVKTLQEIRSIENKKLIPKHKQIKIIMATSDSDKNTVMSCIKEGCDGYIIKPVNKNNIYEKLNQIGFSV